MITYIELLDYLLAHPVEAVGIVFIQFVVFMKIHQISENKSWHKAIHYPLALWFIPQDVIVNLVFMTALGKEIPQEWLVTTRVKRWINLRPDTLVNKWRIGLGTKIAWFLNAVDPGHVK